MKKVLTSTLMLASLGLLISCTPGKPKSVEKRETAFPIEWNSDKPIEEGGTLKVAYVSSSPFMGIFSMQHYQNATDSAILGYMNEIIFHRNGDFEAVGTDTGMATFNLDLENKRIHVKFREGLKWSDGHPLTVDDLIYTYEVLGHKDYTGVRFDLAEHGRILGMKEYNEGKADKISGFEKISDTELYINVSEISPKMITLGGGLIGNILPKHYLQDVPMKDLETSDKIRKNPISNGEFVIKNIVPGESVEFVPNEYYYKGKSKLGKVIFKIIAPQLVLESMKQGEYHSYLEIPGDLYDSYKDLSNVFLIGRPELYYQYMGFNLGHRDEEKGVNVTDRDTPLQDIRVRKALAHALNIDEVAEAYYNGLRERANGVTPPIFSKFYNPSLEGYKYDVEKSKSLLKEAGYEDTNNDGIVDKDGKNLSLQFAFMAGSDVSEPISKAFIQYWKEIGVDIKLTNDRLLDFNLFYDKVQANDDDIDIYVAAWGVGTSLDPSQSTSRRAKFNFTRFTSEENDKLLEAISDPKGLLDPNYKSQAYRAWEEYYVGQAVEVPLMFRYKVSPINKSIKHANLYTDDARGIYQTEIVSSQPEKAE